MPAAKLTCAFLLTALCSCSDKDVVLAGDMTSGAEEPAAIDLVARGQYLVDHVSACPDCHTPRDPMGVPQLDKYLSGAECFVQLENQSCLSTRNLTNHETGLMNRTDAEIKRMIKDGVRPAATGDEALFPVMPYYVFHNMSEQDLDAVVAYLRSVPGVEHAVPRRGPEFDLPAPANPLDLGVVPQPMPGYAEPQAALRGRYLATQAGVCVECHTRHDMTSPNVIDYAGIFAGGEEFNVGLPTIPISKNLTSDMETGLGEWTVEEIVKVLEQGTDKHGDGICPPMPVGPLGAFGGLTDADTLDIAHYIKSLPPQVNAIEDVCKGPPM